MTFLPIVARELRVASRLPGTYWVRGGAALALIVFGIWYFFINAGLPAQNIAVGLFWGLTGSVILYCLFKGVWSTADCLSEEKREGTLGLLFLTDLKGYDVVLGKLAATSLNGLYAVLGAVPMLAVPILMGGVAPGEVARMALVAVNSLFFSLAIGICVSALSRSPLKAMLATFLLILLFAALLPACGAWVCARGWTAGVSRGWLLASAGFSYYWALDVPYTIRPEEFWRSLAVIHGLGWMFLLLACVIAPRVWQIRPTGVQMPRWRRWTRGDREEQTGFRKRLLKRGAYFWLAARVRLKPVYVWAVPGLVACAWVLGLAKFHSEWFSEETYILSGMFLNFVIKIWFAIEAGRQVGEDRREGGLELLLTTPLTVRDILRGQLLALRRQFQWPVLAVLVVFGFFWIAGVSDPDFQQDPEGQAMWTLCWAVAIVMLVADLAALYWLGMWRGLVARNPIRATAEALGCTLLLPWAGATLVMLAASIVWPNAESQPIMKFFLALWFGLGLAADAGFGAWARHKLLTEFRLAATRRYERPAGIWKRLLGAS